MSNTPLTYNTSGPISGTEQVGDLAAGVLPQDYGKVGQDNSVIFWNSPNDTSGYLVGHTGAHQGHTASGLTPANVGFFRSEFKTNESFISLAEYISRQDNDPQSFLSASEASTWLSNHGYWNTFSDVVTDGLTLRLDASNTLSYPGSGNIWYDLVYPQENITLVNSPTFTLASPSYFGFNGTTQYGNGTDPVLSTSSYTKSVWFYLNSYQDNNLVSSNTGGHFMYMHSSNRIYCGHSDWPDYLAFPSNATFDLNTWYYVALTFNTNDGMKLYVNGILDSVYTANKSPLPGDGSTNIASYVTGNLLNGRIARVFCYNRSLTSAEVLDNYNGTELPFLDPTPTPTSSLTATPTPSVTVTQTQTPTPTITPTETNTPTPSVTVTPTQTNTPTPSVTSTSTPTVTPTNTNTQTPTPSITASQTVTPTPSITASQTVTPTTTETPTNTPTVTQTNTPTNTLTPTTTTTPTPTPTTQNFLLFEDGSIATAENNDNIQIDI